MEISKIHHPVLSAKGNEMDMLRLDLIHPAVSGNKWFKLKYNIEQAKAENKNTLLSFGGAYSNHLHALAYAGKLYGFQTIGMVRGESVNNKTLEDCIAWGMQINFLSREDYRNKNEDSFTASLIEKYPQAFIIPEGGNNQYGIRGCSEILEGTDLLQYDVIVCSVGTGATLSGIINASDPRNRVLGFTAVKNGGYLAAEIAKNTEHDNWQLCTDYHFGGFAGKNETLLNFMKDFYDSQSIELDFVYNAKMMYGLFDMIQQNRLPARVKILVIHTGGLQGNRSLM